MRAAGNLGVEKLLVAAPFRGRSGGVFVSKPRQSSRTGPRLTPIAAGTFRSGNVRDVIAANV